MRSNRASLCAGIFAAMTLTFSPAGQAAPGDSLYAAADGHVFAEYLGHWAAFRNTLSLKDFGPIFVNKTTPEGTVVDLGFFRAGTPLVFDIYVEDTDHFYFTGPARSNSDGVAHADVTFGRNRGATIGFEDLHNGGDLDYDDLLFNLSNVAPVGVSPIPEPGTYALMFAGLGLVGWMFRRKASA